MGNNLKTYLEKNIPFALFRAPGKSIRLVAQRSPLSFDVDFSKTGFHFAPFSKREKVPHIVIRNDVDVLLGNKNTSDSLSNKIISVFQNNFISISKKETRPLENNSKEISVSLHTYKKHINTYLEFFKNNDTQKAIYSRIKKINLSEEFDLIAFFEKIEKAYDRAMVYLVHLPGIGLWAGASPETLLKYKNGTAETVALAGTQKILEAQNVEDLEWGKKEIEEHQMVVNYITDKIKRNHLKIINDLKPYTSRAGAMAHLKQRFEFKINKTQLPKFINELHPTPAVCGLPKAKALDLIYQTEPYDRQYYAGYLGMVEENDTVDFYVNLRCMKIYNNTAALFVGGGITANSIPEKEWEETELKSKTLLNVLDLITV